jgi:hypothetical protein
LSFDPPVLNTPGDIAFGSFLTGPAVNSSNNFGIWSGSSSPLNLVAQSGDHAPGTEDGVKLAYMQWVRFNALGQVGFLGNLAGTNVNSLNRQGIWKDSAGDLELMVRTGEQAFGMPDGANYYTLRPLDMNSNGKIVFSANVIGGGVSTTNDSGIWSVDSNSRELIAAEGSQAPGAPSGLNFGSFSAYAVNGAGNTLIVASLIGEVIDQNINYGMWSESTGALDIIVRTGSQAPGTPSGATFSFLRQPVLNANGLVTFQASLTGTGVDSTNSSGIWSDGSGVLELVARTGSRPPGTPDGVSFNSMFFPTMNAAGQISFQGRMSGAQTGYGIWTTDVNGILRLVVRAGDILEVAPSEFRTVSSVTLGAQQQEAGSGNEDGRPSTFNDRGQVAFLASFTDGSSGVFVSDAVLNDGALPGDFNADSVVDVADYVIWRANYSDQRAGYNIWRANFGRVAGSVPLATMVPEPSAFLLLVLAGPIVGWSRRAVRLHPKTS